MRKYAHPLVLVGAVFLSGLSLNAANPPVAKPPGLQAITKSDERILTFVRPARIVEVVPDIGDEVKANQIIARQDDTEEQAALALDIHKAEVSDLIAMKAEEAVLEKDVNKLKDLKASNAAAKTEIDEQELAVKVDHARIDNANDQIEQDKLKVKQGQANIAKLTLRVPPDITGTWIVGQPNPNQSLLKVGEIADGSGAKCLHIIKIDPLWVDVSVPLLDARKLNANDPAQITFIDPRVASGTRIVSGKVLKRMPTAEAASGTLVVRIEVPNPERLEPGETVFVNFAPAAGVAAKP